MKILIVGEFSGFAKNLSIGFKALGHEAVIIGYGDGWKKIDVGENGHLLDYCRNYQLGNIPLRKTWMLRSWFHFYKVKELISKYRGYFDVILIINYSFIRLKYERWYPYFSIEELKNMLTPEGKIFLSACGGDFPTDLYCPKLRYTYFPDVKDSPFLKKRMMKIFHQVSKSVQGVIPVMYEYGVAYRSIARQYELKIFDTIPLPVDTTNLAVYNVLEDKIVIFHGKLRLSKGTDLIQKALDKLKKKYPDKVEILIEGGMPLEKYLKLILKTNIIIDQAWSYSYGMNAIFGMAMGKVVLSGNEPECGQEFERKDIPIINILPDVKDIFNKLEFLVNHPEEIKKKGLESEIFVKDFHRTEKVAEQYVRVFEA